MEAGGVGAAGAVLESAVPEADELDVAAVMEAALRLLPEGQGVGGGPGGGVEDGEPRPCCLGGRVGEETPGGIPDGQGVGLLQGAGGVGGLDGEVPQVADGLHQGTAQQGAAGEVHGQGQLPAHGLRVELAGAVDDETAHAALQRRRVPAEGGEQGEELRAETVRRQGEGGQQPHAGAQLRRGGDGAAGEARKARVQHPLQAGRAGGGGRIEGQFRHGDLLSGGSWRMDN